MADFDAEEFEAEKYTTYFPKLQTAYKRAFDRVNAEYGSDLVHALDQRVLNESEPHYEDGEFHLDVPDEPRARLPADVDGDRAEEVLEEYVDEIEAQLADVFAEE